MTLLMLLFAGSSRADEPRIYEVKRVDVALRAGGYERDSAPAGKRIAFIRFVREEVFVGEELVVPIVLPPEASTWPNAFHWLTEESVIRRELLFQEGDLYDVALIEESERNLRALGILALARIEAVRGARPDEVGLLVYTRDLWSLRLETGFSGAGEAYGVTAQLIERNLLGRNKQLALRWDTDRYAFSLGQVYIDRRVAGQPLSLTESFDVIFNYDTGKAEGSQGQVLFGKPYYDLQQRFAWTVAASYSVSIVRQQTQTQIIALRPVEDGDDEECVVGEPRCYQRVYDRQRVAASAGASYRVGQQHKQTYSLELGYSDLAIEPNEDTLVESGTREEVVDWLPPSRRQVYPKISYSLWLPRYAVLENLSTFGQSEGLRIGPELKASFAAPLEAFGSSSDSLLFSASAGYVWSERNALVEASAGASTRLEDGRASDQSLSLMARGATPPFALGRFVGIVSYAGRRRDTDGALVAIGGDSGLRGYGANAFYVYGGSSLRGSTEYRSLPLELSSVHIGGVLFYDVGGVYTSIERLQMHHAVGTGVRVLFPQFNRYPFRLDVGFPLGEGGFAVALSYGSDQAIALTAADEAQERTVVRPQ